MTAMKTCLGAGMLKEGVNGLIYCGESNIDLIYKVPDHMLPRFVTVPIDVWCRLVLKVGDEEKSGLRDAGRYYPTLYFYLQLGLHYGR